MALPVPNLDDRSFADLVADAAAEFKRRCPDWDGLSVHDPAAVLLEVFAYVTDILLYRLNRVPQKNYVEFLNLLGVKLVAPAAARVRLRFSLASPAATALEIPRGTQVTVSRNSAREEPVVFSTTEVISIPAGASEAFVTAIHAEEIAAERVGVGTGLPFQTFQVAHPPIIARAADSLDILVGVEASEEETRADDLSEFRREGERIFRVWREAADFGAMLAGTGPGSFSYTVDRVRGEISFAPAAQLRTSSGELDPRSRTYAHVPQKGREIRVWYRRGGGARGNVARAALDAFKTPLAGVSVTNPEPAAGGRDAEPLENALRRGPTELRSLQRAITASDFEQVAREAGAGVSRAKALPLAQRYVHAQPGSVEVTLVPELTADEAGPFNRAVRQATLEGRHVSLVRDRVQRELDERCTIGTKVDVHWARYKTVSVRSRVVAQVTADPAAIRERILERLYATISPLPSALRPQGWGFGRELRTSNVYEIILREPGINYVQDVELVLESRDVPATVTLLERATKQGKIAYAASEGGTLFRTINAGVGWERMHVFPGREIEAIAVHPQIAGLVAVAVKVDDTRSEIHFSEDCVDSFGARPHIVVPSVRALAFSARGGAGVLLMGTVEGLLRVGVGADDLPSQLIIQRENPTRAVHELVTATDGVGKPCVVALLDKLGGVFVSHKDGDSGTFRALGLANVNVRTLQVELSGSRRFLWAGLAVTGNQTGDGCRVCELRDEGSDTEFSARADGWSGGSCTSLTFDGDVVYAATQYGGVLRRPAAEQQGPWQGPPKLECGLPIYSKEQASTNHFFEPVRAVVVLEGGILLAGGKGISRATQPGVYEPSARAVFRGAEVVSVPETWLLCSGEHEIEVKRDANGP